MTERPILFSAPMVRALLDGRKTQTRRIIKCPPSTGAFVLVGMSDGGWWPYKSMDGESTDDGTGCETPMNCRYGVPGDRLWVKEAFTFVNMDRERNLLCVAYDADGESLPTRVDRIVTPEQLSDFMGDEREKIDPFKRRRYPAMFMNRWASRLTRENTAIRAQRLLEISEEDAIAEGLACVTKDGSLYKYGIPDLDGLPGGCDIGWPWHEWDVDPRVAYFKLWDKINGVDAHKLNPWVWAASFKELTA